MPADIDLLEPAPDTDLSGSDNTRTSWTQHIPHIITGSFLVLMILLVIWAWRSGVLESRAVFQDFISSLGWPGPLVYTALLTVGTVFPVFPNPLIMGAGIIAFGSWPAFFFNYIALTLGSIFIFTLSRRYGRKLIERMFGPKKVQQWLDRAQKKGRFDRWFFILIILPVAPDDLLCYIAGLTDMSRQRYMLINIIGRPWTLLLYSAGLGALLHI